MDEAVSKHLRDSALGKQQEAAVDKGMAQGQRVAVDAARKVHQRHDNGIGEVLDLPDVDAGGDAPSDRTLPPDSARAPDAHAYATP
jgi:hypothetical protein